MVYPLWKKLSQETKNRTTTRHSNSILGYIAKTRQKRKNEKKKKTLIKKDIYIPMFIAVLFTIAKIQKQHKCQSTDD